MKKQQKRLQEKAENMYRCGEYRKAQKICHQILKDDSNSLEALTILGNISFLLHDYEQAIKYYQRIETISPQYIINLLNLSNVYFEQNNFTDSQKYAHLALEQNPQDITALSLLGNSLFAQEQYDSALQVFLHLLEQKPKDCWTLNSLSQIHQKQGDYEQAFNCAFSAVENSCGDDAQQLNLGYLLYETALEKGYDFIKNKVELWKQKYGELAQVSYMINALENNQYIEVADSSYLQNVFDNFASGFEQVLSGLDYSAPQHIEEYMQEFYSNIGWKKLHILDAGCGTGLCGLFLKKYASWRGLDGVDISLGMLAEAKKKKIYSKLFQQELCSFLTSTKKHYDLIVASDVLTYFGNLDNVILGFSNTLKKQGRIIFTITQNSYNDSSWYLHSSGRFAHNIVYVEELLQKHGFYVEKSQFRQLRLENNNPVMGYIISAKKSS